MMEMSGLPLHTVLHLHQKSKFINEVNKSTHMNFND